MKFLGYSFQKLDCEQDKHAHTRSPHGLGPEIIQLPGPAWFNLRQARVGRNGLDFSRMVMDRAQLKTDQAGIGRKRACAAGL